jgi:hypothetical protein
VSEIDQWIADAALSLGRDFSPATPSTSVEAISKAKAAFVRGNPRVWWLGLLHAPRVVSSAHEKLVNLVPPGKAWLMPEHGAEGGAIYELAPKDIDAIRENCPLFEFNVVDRDFRWMVSESDHDMFLISIVPGST